MFRSTETRLSCRDMVNGFLMELDDHNCWSREANDAVLIVDETADAKSFADWTGASRSYSGRIGDIAMCQVMVPSPTTVQWP